MSLAQFRALLPRGDLWVFGYGSLMWSPGFYFRERAVGLLRGYHRSLCILSTRYRGTDHQPGLVMGLCRGGSCWGMAYRIDRGRLRRALARLWEREMPRQTYHPRLVAVRLRGGRVVKALGMVQCADDFTEHPKVINGFSDLMVEVFGDAGRHARSAVGMGSLPFGIAVEVEMILEVSGPAGRPRSARSRASTRKARTPRRPSPRRRG